MSEGEPKFEEEKPKEIKDAETFPELFEILKAKKKITSSIGKEIDTEHIADAINMMRIEIYDDLDNPIYSMEHYDDYINEKLKQVNRKYPAKLM